MALSERAQAKMDELVKEFEPHHEERPPSDAKVMGVLDDAFRKFLKGEKKNGVFELETDKRDFLYEAELELLDSINYSAFEILRLRKLRTLRDEVLRRMDEKHEEPTV